MSLLATRLNSMRVVTDHDKNERRPHVIGGFDLFLQQTQSPTGVINSELMQKAAVSIGNTIETAVIKYDSGLTIGSARTLTIPSYANSSEMRTFTFETVSFGFTQTPVEFLNNEIGAERDFMAKMDGYLKKLQAWLDNKAMTVLEAAKTAVIGDNLGYTVNANVVEATQAKKDYILNDLVIMMETNDYYGNINVIGNAGIKSEIDKLAQNGLYNAENKALQYQNKRFFFSNRLANGAGTVGSMFMIQDDQVGLLYRFERECLAGTIARTGHEWGIDQLPRIGLPVGTYFYQTVSDQSALGGAATADMDRVVTNHYGFAVDICFVEPYTSDPTTMATPVIKATITAA